MIKIDFHTHSTASPDGGLCLEYYRKALSSGRLDYAAITDHDTVGSAQKIQRELGEQIIVGEEISSLDGHIIGLYLTHAVEPGLSAAETIAAIHAQDGLVYIPHPLETVRHGLALEVLNVCADGIDIIEGYNGRAFFQNKSREAIAWAAEHHKPTAAGSDAHGRFGWPRTYTELPEAPTRENLVDVLTKARCVYRPPLYAAVLYPKFNRLRHKINLVQ